MFQASTNAATSDDGGGHAVDGLLWVMTTVEARALLPTFQTAMQYAVADTDRAERVVDDPVLGMERGELLPPLPWPARLVGKRNRRLVGRAILDGNPLTNCYPAQDLRPRSAW